MKSPLGRFGDESQFLTFSSEVNPNTGEHEETWTEVVADRFRCNLVKNTEDRITDEPEVSRAIYRLMIPPDCTVNGDRINVKDHRISDVTLKTGEVEAGPFEILEVLPRRNRHRTILFTTLMIERVNQEEF